MINLCNIVLIMCHETLDGIECQKMFASAPQELSLFSHGSGSGHPLPDSGFHVVWESDLFELIKQYA